VILHKNYYSADSLEKDFYEQDRINDDEKRRMTESVPPTPAIRRAISKGEISKEYKSFKIESEPLKPPKPLKPRPSINRQKTFSKNHEMPDTNGVPRYMEWYSKSKETSVSSKVPPVKAKRKNLGRSQEKLDEKVKPEPFPRNTPSKEATRLLKEDLEMARKVESRTQLNDASNHPLLQYSEHRFEHEYMPQPNISHPPHKLPHYMYPNTPPTQSEPKINIKYKPNASPINENEVSKTTTTIKIPIDQNGVSNPNITTTTTTTTLMNTQHEDDHDSGIAMNSLLHGKRNKIADKKSIFTIAYDDVNIKRIQMSESDDPPMS
jgi:hypothetical protein